MQTKYFFLKTGFNQTLKIISVYSLYLSVCNKKVLSKCSWLVLDNCQKKSILFLWNQKSQNSHRMYSTLCVLNMKTIGEDYFLGCANWPGMTLPGEERSPGMTLPGEERSPGMTLTGEERHVKSFAPIRSITKKISIHC